MNKKDHKVYERTTEKNADACAWVYSDKENFQKYFYKHPKLETNEVRIKIERTGLCMSDSHTGRAKWGIPNYPICVGHEIIGKVEALGSEVKNFKIGERVMMGPFRDHCHNCDMCKKGLNSYCMNYDWPKRGIYGEYWGGYSTHCQHPSEHVFKCPENIDYKTIAPIMCAGMTTFLPLFEHAKKGDKVAIIGCGGLGHFGVQWAKKMGCEVDVFSSSHNKDELIKQLGGNKVYNWRENEHKDLKAHYNIILNTLPCLLNKEEFDLMLDCLKPLGKWLQVGLPEFDLYSAFKTEQVVMKGLSIIGSLVGSIKDYKNMLDFVKEHGIECKSEIYEFDQFPEALEKMENGSPKLRCVVNVENFKLQINFIQSIQKIHIQIKEK